MKHTGLVALSVTLAALAPELADARPRPKGGIKGKKFEANKGFGLGLELGSPSGITGKYFLDNGSNALQFGVGSIYGYRDRYGLHFYFDFLWHPVSLVSASAFELPLFVGVGGRFWDFEDRRDRFYYEGHGFGVRVPVGIAFDFNNVPLDIFFQLIPTLDFYRDYYYDEYGIWIDASIGIRYFFN